MIEMIYRNDHKEKWQSHEIGIRENGVFNAEIDDGIWVWSHNPFNIGGYGATKEEAIEDFKKKFEYIMKELKAFETMLLDTDVITCNIVEVDCFGKEIEIK